jgi:integrase
LKSRKGWRTLKHIRLLFVEMVKLKGGEKKEVHCVVGLRDRALIGLMVFTFARVGAAIGMKVEDYFIQGRRGWVRLHESCEEIRLSSLRYLCRISTMSEPQDG